MPASPAHLSDSMLTFPLPPGWHRQGTVYTAQLPSRGNGAIAALAKCVAPDVYLFGTTQLTASFVGPKHGAAESFEEQIGRTKLPSVEVAHREDSSVSAIELACIKSDAAQLTHFAYAIGPTDPVQPWSRVLLTSGVVSASHSTFGGEADTSVDVIKNGYFARLDVSVPAGSPLTDELLKAAIGRM